MQLLTWLQVKSVSSRPERSFSNELCPACLRPYNDLLSRKTYLCRLLSTSSIGVTSDGNSIYTGTSGSACGSAKTKSMLLDSSLCILASMRSIRILAHVTTRAYISQLSWPYGCCPPCAHKRALCLLRLPSGYHFLLNDQIAMVVLIPSGRLLLSISV